MSKSVPARGNTPPPVPSSSAPATRAVWPAVVCDVLCVVVFTVVGTMNHDSAGSVGHVAGVGLPFLVALAVGWLASRAWRAPAQVWPTGVAVWFSTFALGLLLRIIFGGGFATSFAVVTAVFLGVTMLGWRAIATFSARRAPAA